LNAIIVLGAALVIILCAVLEVRRQMRARERVQGLRLRPGPRGEVVVPITAAFSSVAKNSMRPCLIILPDGIRFRVLGEGRWAFSELTQVSAGRTLFGASLRFMCRNKGELRVHLASRDLARQVLTFLPPEVPLTRSAAALRLETP
jgi:hypothetical protein